MKHLHKIIYTASLFLIPAISFSQQKNLLLNRQYGLNIEKHLYPTGVNIHTGFKPHIESLVNNDSIRSLNDSLQGYRAYTSLISRKIKQEPAILIKQDDFTLSITPLFNFEFNRDLKDSSVRADTAKFYTNSRGLWVRGDIGKKVSFESTFTENQSFFVNYIDDFVKKNGVVPGQGRVKPFKGSGYDYAMATGYISYTPIQKKLFLNLQLGNGKHFIGEGYRSLLLSDNAFSYPYFKITSQLGRFQYTNMYASLQNLNRVRFSNTPEALFERKRGSFHYISWNVHRNIQLGVFEGIIWQAQDTSGKRMQDINYIIPIIGVNTLINGFNSNNNAVAGLNIKIIPFNKFALYGQLALDDPSQTRFGWQLGYKWFDAFTIKNLHLQAEFNHARPNTYDHKVSLQSYSHYSQYLAYTLGNNVQEAVGIINYNWKDLYLQVKTNYITTLNTSAASLKTPTVKFIDEASISYLVNRATQSNFTLGITNRMLNNGANGNRILFIAFRTSLFNNYYDF